MELKDKLAQLLAPSTPLSLGAVMYGLRMHESRGIYTARSSVSSASGAYQYTDGTWGRYRGYARAWMAPAQIQDERAAADLAAYRDRFGSWEAAVAMHFTGDEHLVRNRARWNEIPGHPSNPTVNGFVRSVMRLAGTATGSDQVWLGQQVGDGGDQDPLPPAVPWAEIAGLLMLAWLLGRVAVGGKG